MTSSHLKANVIDVLLEEGADAAFTEEKVAAAEAHAVLQARARQAAETMYATTPGDHEVKTRAAETTFKTVYAQLVEDSKATSKGNVAVGGTTDARVPPGVAGVHARAIAGAGANVGAGVQVKQTAAETFERGTAEYCWARKDELYALVDEANLQGKRETALRLLAEVVEVVSQTFGEGSLHVITPLVEAANLHLRSGLRSGLGPATAAVEKIEILLAANSEPGAPTNSAEHVMLPQLYHLLGTSCAEETMYVEALTFFEKSVAVVKSFGIAAAERMPSLLQYAEINIEIMHAKIAGALNARAGGGSGIGGTVAGAGAGTSAGAGVGAGAGAGAGAASASGGGEGAASPAAHRAATQAAAALTALRTSGGGPRVDAGGVGAETTTPTAVTAPQLAVQISGGAGATPMQGGGDAGGHANAAAAEAAAAVDLNSLPKDALAMMQKYAGNVAKDPNNAKFRQIRLQNEKFAAIVWRHDAAQLLLTAAGWSLRIKEGYLVLPLELDCSAILKIIANAIEELELYD